MLIFKKSDICFVSVIIKNYVLHVKFSDLFPGFFLSQAMRNRKYLIDFCMHFLKLKDEVLEKAAFKVIFFNEEYEHTFFSNKLPANLRLINSNICPNNILF